MKRAVLVILDGVGVAMRNAANPRTHAKTPTLDRLEQESFAVTLQASGISVGLPWGEAGNSEVGHLNIGAGRLIYHHLPRIIVAIRDGSFFRNPAFRGAFAHAKRTGGRVHVMGLISSGSVHAYVDHLYALFELARREGLPIMLHVFTDGRDAGPREALKFLSQIEERMRTFRVGRIATLCGRHFAMDRNGSWPLTEKCYRLLTRGEGGEAASVTEALQRSYAEGVTDEYLPPTRIRQPGLIDIPTVQSGDALIFFNFREDSARQLAESFGFVSFAHFERPELRNFLFVTMTEYQKDLNAAVAFPTSLIQETFGEVVAQAGLSQLRIAETEKYAHVTYFFNGGSESPFEREERYLITSYSDVPHDQVPEMRAREISEAVVRAIESKSHDIIIANIANGDMVGHSGNFTACARTFEALDVALEPIVTTATLRGVPLFITADHGNVEEKIDLISGRALTEHTTNPVPFFAIVSGIKPLSLIATATRVHEPVGLLIDVAPTILGVLGIPLPASMTGQNLLERRLETETA